MMSASGANCIYFEPSDSGGVCNHPDTRKGFWIFSYKGECILTYEGKVFKAECELRVPKIREPKTIRTARRLQRLSEETKISTPTKTPAPIKKSSGTHKHNPKKHIHKRKEK